MGYDDVAVRGDTALVHFTVPAARLGFHGMGMRFRVEPGDATFHVGPTSTTVNIGGDVEHPDPNRVPAFAVTTS